MRLSWLQHASTALAGRRCCLGAAVNGPTQQLSRRGIQLSANQADVESLSPDALRNRGNLEGPDAQFEIIGAPFSLLSASLAPSQTLFTRRGTLVGLSGKAENVISTLRVVQPLRRSILGIPFLYQKITSASPATALLASRSPHNAFATVLLDGTIDWMVAQRRALLAWTGETLSVTPTANTKLSITHWAQSRVTGRGLLALVGQGQIYEISLKSNERYVIHPSHVVAYTLTKSPPIPYRFKASTLHFEVPGARQISTWIQNLHFVQVLQGSDTWLAVQRLAFAARTYSRRTIWGDRLFLQFQGPATILLQTRGPRVADVLTSREVNEIADTEPGAVSNALKLESQPEQSATVGATSTAATAASPRVSHASVGGDGKVTFGT